MAEHAARWKAEGLSPKEYWAKYRLSHPKAEKAGGSARPPVTYGGVLYYIILSLLVCFLVYGFRDKLKALFQNKTKRDD
jgi:hypothetical protein